ncbi:MAG TPA: hypothetical protein VK171_02935 [Fimbriimonas sp.]|nr:hypothetical protein [Fimbriimonas sp.]
MSRTKLLLVFFVSVCILGIWYPLFTARVKPQNDHWSDTLVTNALQNANGVGTVPKTNLGVSLPMREGTVEEILKVVPNESYKSAFGLQGYIAVWTWKVMGQPSLPLTVKVLRVLYSMLLAAVLLPFAWSLRKQFGTVAFALVCAMIPTSILVSNFGRSLHWQGWLIFLPVVYGWVMYPSAVEEGRLKQYWAIIIGLVMLRSLVGYEFLSNIAIALMIRPAVYHLHFGELGARWKKITLSAVGATVVGFMLAAFIHVGVLSSEVGGPAQAISHIKSRVSDRMSTKLTGEDAVYAAVDNPSVVEIAKPYLVDFGPYMLPVGLSLLAGIILSAVIFKDWLSDRTNRRTQEELILLGLGGLASASWALLMRNHMIVGVVHNGIIFYLPFYFLLAAVVGRRMEEGLQRANSLDVAA